MAIGMAQKIIIKGDCNLITFNIIDINDPKEIQDTLKKIHLRTDEQVVYSVLQEILNYLCIHKLKIYNKSVIEILTKICFSYKWLNVAMIIKHNLFDIIVIVIILNTLHSDFEATTLSLLETKDKIIKEIQSIILLKKVKYKTK